MRCRRAQEMMAAAVDRALGARERDALDAHLAGCAACRDEMTTTASLLEALARLPRETDVPARLEQETLRRVRLAADEPAGRPRWVFAVPALALAAGLVVAVSVGLLRRGADVPPGSVAAVPAPGRVASVPPARKPEPLAPTAVARAPRPAVRPAAPAPVEPPPALAAAPDLFVDLPILRNLEKLSHFDAIQTTTLDAQRSPDGNG